MTACKLNSPDPTLLLSPNQCLPPPTAQPFQDTARPCRPSILTPALCSLHPPSPRVLLSIHEHRPEPGTQPSFFLLRFILSRVNFCLQLSSCSNSFRKCSSPLSSPQFSKANLGIAYHPSRPDSSSLSCHRLPPLPHPAHADFCTVPQTHCCFTLL